MSLSTQILLIAFAGSAGALIRLVLTELASRRGAPTLGAVAANTLGSLGAGIVLAMPFGVWSWILAVGLFGATSTLSTLAVDVAEQWRQSPQRGLRLALFHVGGGVGGFALGYLPLVVLG